MLTSGVVSSSADVFEYTEIISSCNRLWGNFFNFIQNILKFHNVHSFLQNEQSNINGKRSLARNRKFGQAERPLCQKPRRVMAKVLKDACVFFRVGHGSPIEEHADDGDKGQKGG
jgi:hypothetical protein